MSIGIGSLSFIRFGPNRVAMPAFFEEPLGFEKKVRFYFNDLRRRGDNINTYLLIDTAVICPPDDWVIYLRAA
jgi:hypothetical protein